MKLGLLLLIICILQIDCKKEIKSFSNEGVITGRSVSDCVSPISCPNICDGSLYFHFTDIPDTTQVYIDNPNIFNLPQNGTFPFRVLVDYQITTRCGISAIRVVDYKLL